MTRSNQHNEIIYSNVPGVVSTFKEIEVPIKNNFGLSLEESDKKELEQIKAELKEARELANGERK